MAKGAMFGIVTLLVIAVLALQLFTLASQAPRLTTTTVTSVSVTTKTLTTTSDYVVIGNNVSTFKGSDGAGGFVTYGVTIDYSIARFAPYLTNNSGYKYVNMFIVANLCDSSGRFLAVAHAASHGPPGTRGILTIVWQAVMP